MWRLRGSLMQRPQSHRGEGARSGKAGRSLAPTTTAMIAHSPKCLFDDIASGVALARVEGQAAAASNLPWTQDPLTAAGQATMDRGQLGPIELGPIEVAACRPPHHRQGAFSAQLDARGGAGAAKAARAMRELAPPRPLHAFDKALA